MSRSTGKAGRSTRLNTTLAIALGVLVALGPLPLGSNRPIFWALGAFLIAVVMLVYLWRLQVDGNSLRYDPRRLGPVLWLALAYLAYLIVQTLPLGALFGPFTAVFPYGSFSHDAISLSVGDTRIAALRVAGYGLLFVGIAQVAVNRNRAHLFAWSLFATAAFWATYGLLSLVQLGDTVLFFEKWAYRGSATGPFVNRNSFATYLAMGLVLGLGLVIGDLTRAQSRKDGPAPGDLLSGQAIQRYIAILALLVIAAALFRTGSRMGVFSGAIGAGLTLLLIVVRRQGFGPRGWILAITGYAVALALSALAFGSTLVERIADIGDTALVRTELYAQVLDMIAARPWTGWGADSFEVVYRAFRAAPVDAGLTWERAHSTYLAHWAETGVIFGSIPLLIIAIAFIACMRAALVRSVDTVMPAIGAGVILTGAVHSLVDFSLEMQANVWMFIAIITLALARGESRIKPPVQTPTV